MSGVNLQAIYERLNSVPRYHPMSANTYGDWAMEAGDIVTVSREGTGYQSPVGKSTLKWTGKQQIQISSDGSRERNPISKVSAQKYAKSGGGTSGMRGSQELYWEMYSEDGQLHAQISATAEALTSDYSSQITNTNSRITQTAEQIRTEVVNVEKRLTTQINQTDRSISLAVGRVKYSSTETYANKGSFPTTGTAGVLYTAQDTGKSYLYMPGTHSYELAAVDEYGNANFLKAGEIAISINESGQTEAKLDATRVLAGKGALTIDDLELPDWMDTTEGLIATKATIVDLNALRARVGTLEADTLKTSALYSAIGNLDTVRVKKLSVASGGNIKFEGSNVTFTDSTAANVVTNLKIELNSSTNTYTLSKYTLDDGGGWTEVGSFNRATTLSGEYGGDNTGDTATYKVTATPQGNEITGSFKVKENKNSAWIEDANGAIRARIDNPEWNNGGKTAAISSVTATSGKTASMVLGFGTQYLITPKYTNKSGSAVNTGNTYVIQSPAFPSVTLDCDSVGDEDYDVAGNVYAKANGSTKVTKQITVTKGAIKDNGKMAMNAYCDGTRVNRTWATFSAAKLYADHYDSAKRRYYFYSTLNITSSNRMVFW